MSLIDCFITIIWVVSAIIWFLRKRGGIWSLRDIFFLTLSYYALCVPLDLLLGLELTHYEGLFSLESDWARPYISQILSYNLFCLFGFFLSYSLLPKCAGKTALPMPVDIKKSIKLPSRAFAIIPGVTVLVLYVANFWIFNRRQRNLLSVVGNDHLFYNMLILIFTAFFLFYIWHLNDKSKARIIVCLGILLSLVVGARTYAVVSILVYIARYKISFSKTKLILFVLGAFMFANYGKFVANQLRLFYVEGKFNYEISEIPAPSLSRIEGGLAYNIFAFELSMDESPLLLGETYVLLTFQEMITRYLTGDKPERLTEQLMRNYLPSVRERGNNFSYPALAEAWLNFGLIGPPLIGFLIGIIVRYFDRRPRGIAFLTLFFFLMRFFRSDFTSVFKLNIVIIGGLLLCMYCIFFLINILCSEAQHGEYGRARARLGA